jgi:hypothetical protein
MGGNRHRCDEESSRRIVDVISQLHQLLNFGDLVRFASTNIEQVAMTKREDIQQQRLEGLEVEFRSLLPSVLKECAAGRWGLFGQNDQSNGRKYPYLHWAKAEHLKNMAYEIRSIRLQFGESNPRVERFLHYCSLRGPDVQGEPTIAQALLDEVESKLFTS